MHDCYVQYMHFLSDSAFDEILPSVCMLILDYSEALSTKKVYIIIYSKKNASRLSAIILNTITFLNAGNYNNIFLSIFK